jgi:hypothetical protein
MSADVVCHTVTTHSVAVTLEAQIHVARGPARCIDPRPMQSTTNKYRMSRGRTCNTMVLLWLCIPAAQQNTIVPRRDPRADTNAGDTAWLMLPRGSCNACQHNQVIGPPPPCDTPLWPPAAACAPCPCRPTDVYTAPTTATLQPAPLLLLLLV